MPEKFNTANWTTTSFRIDAEAKIDEIDRDLREVEARINTALDTTFHDPDVAERIRKVSDHPSIALFDTMTQLAEDPSKFGDLRGFPLLGNARSAARESAKALPPLLEERADLLSSRRDYERLGYMTVVAERVPEAKREPELERLRQEREYCDSNREARRRIHERARSENSDDSSSMKLRTAPAEAHEAIKDADRRAEDYEREVTGSGKIHLPGRNWWERERPVTTTADQTNTERERETKVDAQQQKRDWWNRGQPDEQDPTDPTPERTDDRYDRKR